VQLNQLTITHLATALQQREIAAEELVRACLAHIATREPTIGAWTHLEAEQALRQARVLDGGAWRGPLHGIPVAAKDIFDTHDMPTAYGSSIYARHRPAADAALVAMLRQQGAIVLGKTVTTEFAYFRPGKTRNPHNLDHTPGGSSSGSAAAVADCMVPLALGSQTAASLIRPAAYCGIVGFKSAQGSFPLAGVKALSQTLDSAGWMTRSVADAALVFGALTGAPSEPMLPLAAAPRIALCRTAEWPRADPSAALALEHAATRLAAAGAWIDEIELPPPFDRLVEAQMTVMAYEAVRSLQYEYARHQEALSPQLLALLQSGAALSFDSYRAALESADQGRQYLAELLSRFDALLAPSAPGEAPAGLEATGDPIFSRMWTLMQVPTICLPVTHGSRGLPVGVQLIGPLRDEAKLFAVGTWAEALLAPDQLRVRSNDTAIQTGSSSEKAG